MYALDDRLGARQPLLHATPNGVGVGAPASDLNAPARPPSFWQDLPPRLVRLPKDRPFTPHHDLSPPHVGYGSMDHVRHTGFPQDLFQSSHKLTTERRPPTPPHRDGTHALQSRHVDSNSSYIPQGLPSSFRDLLPHTRENLVSGPNIVNTNHLTMWNTDGTEGNRDDHALKTHQNFSPSAWDHLPAHGLSPQLNYVPQYRSAYVALPAAHDAPQSAYDYARRAYSIVSPPTMIDHYGQLCQMPVIQQWRTDDLAARAPIRVAKKKLDASSRRKQEIYRQKGEARRHTIAAGMSGFQMPVHIPLPTPGPPRAKATASGKRRKVVPAISTTSFEDMKNRRSTSTSTPYHDVYVGSSSAAACLRAQAPNRDKVIVEQPASTSDELPQPIVDKYEDYKWSVYLYELQPSRGYDFAERWLEELFETALQSEYQRRHFSHISKGFIKDGGRHSLLVLHNATNPFEYDLAPYSTVTIGVYGYHWYRHDEIHWTTLGSDQHQLLEQCVQMDHLALKHKWSPDTSNAAEKRFHRAYWLSANRLDLKGLLNRCPSTDEPHDFIAEKSAEDPDEDFSISEADLRSAWDGVGVSAAESVAAWRVALEESDALDDAWVVHGGGWQHVVTGSSEW